MLKKSLYILGCTIILSASSTMCYKKNHFDPSTIESTILDGGKCDGKLSVLDMKQSGYKVDTMKIQNIKNSDGLNYIYIFKKENGINSKNLKAQLEQIQNENKKQKEIDASSISVKNGKKLKYKVFYHF
jgi:hypothetical protein